MKQTHDPKMKKAPGAPKSFDMPGKVKDSPSGPGHISDGDKLGKPMAMDNHEGGYKVLSKPSLDKLSDGKIEMTNVYGLDEDQAMSQETSMPMKGKKD